MSRLKSIGVMAIWTALCLSAHADDPIKVWGSESVHDIKVYYHTDSDTYEVGRSLPGKKYKRLQYERLIKSESITIHPEKNEDFKNTISEHAQHKVLPNLEKRILKNAKVLVKVDEDDSAEDRSSLRDEYIHYERKVIDAVNRAYAAIEGYVPLGDLLSFRVDITNENDNAYNGLLAFAGVTEYGENIEGDDRGDTFSIEGELEAVFDAGTIILRKRSKEFARLSDTEEIPLRDRKKVSSAAGYVVYGHQSKDGKIHIDALTIDNIEIEFKKLNNTNEHFVRITSRYKTMKDQGGLAQNIQDSYHKALKTVMNKFIVYEYNDHLEDQRGFEIEGEYQRYFNLYSEKELSIDTYVNTGINLSTIANSESFASLGAGVRVRFSKDQDFTKRSGFQASIFHQEKLYFDGYKGSQTGLEVLYGYDLESCTFYTNYQMQYNNDRYQNEYGVEEIARHGRLEANHVFGVGADCKL